MKDKHLKSLVKPQGQGSMITKAQGVHLVTVRDTPVEGPEKATRGGRGRGGQWEPIKIPRVKLGLYSRMDPTRFSFNSAITT
jgi:hypothetical protein